MWYSTWRDSNCIDSAAAQRLISNAACNCYHELHHKSYLGQSEIRYGTVTVHRRLVKCVYERWVFSGFTEDRIKNPKKQEFLASLDLLENGKYKPISNLNFLSQLLDNAAYEQIVGHMECHNLLPPLQSAYQKHRSTETATIKVMSDIYRAADACLITLLGLIYKSAPLSILSTTWSNWPVNQHKITASRRF